MRNQVNSSSYQCQDGQRRPVVPRFHRAAFIFIGNMAMADFLLVPISIVILQIELHTRRRLNTDDQDENLDAEIRRSCRLQVIMWVFFMSVSLFSTVIITIDR